MFRCGTIALVGRPNMGKSTLLNALVGQKISITSRKAQTTRYRIAGVQTREHAQFIFIDTPGFQTRVMNTLNQTLNRTVTSTLHDVDVICFIVEAGYWGADDVNVLRLLPNDKPVLLVANKLDLFASRFDNSDARDLELFEFMKKMAQPWGAIAEQTKGCEAQTIASPEQTFAEVIPMSGKNKDDIERLLDLIAEYLPEGEARYEPDTLTDRSERFMAAEILREKVFRYTGDELPYSSSVVIDQFKLDGKMRRIAATILVDRDSHKAMIIGQKGERLKKISTEARLDMEALFDSKVFLETWVKVKRGWADDLAELRAQGLE
ncbi:GTPase Era [Polynucleobacter sp. HIN6]|uniref:GTPase Era n=1 Tax=unclassified Polynucleobacter TaxID=2640945 RepID=UPI002572B1D9|nr:MULTISPECIES: GTPase Era [unclassified Polynucleobacter]BEI34947.1 GTPase Era [Polynucleobacter sp. HIN6]BEI36777.1 GTPase Era [Polynucleobacter sp. HIN7]